MCARLHYSILAGCPLCGTQMPAATHRENILSMEAWLILFQ